MSPSLQKLTGGPGKYPRAGHQQSYSLVLLVQAAHQHLKSPREALLIPPNCPPCSNYQYLTARASPLLVFPTVPSRNSHVISDLQASKAGRETQPLMAAVRCHHRPLWVSGTWCCVLSCWSPLGCSWQKCSAPPACMGFLCLLLERIFHLLLLLILKNFSSPAEHVSCLEDHLINSLIKEERHQSIGAWHLWLYRKPSHAWGM